MNWLVIAPCATHSGVKKAKDLFKKLNVAVHEIYMEGEWSMAVLHDTMKLIMQASHCLIVDSSALCKHKDYNFVFGILAGKKVRTFVFTGKSAPSRYEALDTDLHASLTISDKLSVLLSEIDTSFDEFLKRETQQQALVQLFTLGIPLTSDSFAHYLEKDDTEVCTLFLDAGMLVNSRTSEGVPLLCVAARSELLDKVEWLVERGADINAISNDRGYSAVMDAVWRKNIKITEYLIKKGANLDVISSDGQPILVLAVGNGNIPIVKLLLEHGADPDIKDSMGMSAREYVNLFKQAGLMELMQQFPKKES